MEERIVKYFKFDFRLMVLKENQIKFQLQEVYYQDDVNILEGDDEEDDVFYLRGKCIIIINFVFEGKGFIFYFVFIGMLYIY